jgi:hypothetical protein
MMIEFIFQNSNLLVPALNSYITSYFKTCSPRIVFIGLEIENRPIKTLSVTWTNKQ